MGSDFHMADYSLALIDRLVVVGRWMLSRFPQATWCPPPVDVEEHDHPHQQNTLVYLGRLAEHKGLQGLVRSLRLLPDHRLVLIGNGHLRDDLLQIAKEEGVDDRLDLVYGDLRATRHLGKGDTFVLASAGEGASISLVEALGAGMKVVATEVGDATWLAKERGVPVALIPNDSPEAIMRGVLHTQLLPDASSLPPQYSLSYFKHVWKGTIPLADADYVRAVESVPRVSVVMPVWGYKHLMDGAIHSILSQMDDLEVVLVDDGNQDDTYDLMRGWEGKDARIKAVKQPENLGLSGARNRGIREAGAPLVALLDPDDRYIPGFLERRAAYHEENPDVLLSFGWALAVKDGVPLGVMYSHDYCPDVQTGTNQVYCQSVMVPRWAFVAAGGNEPHWRYAEDWGTWARLAAAGATHYDQALAYELHSHGEQRSRVGDKMPVQYEMNARVAYHNAFCMGYDRPLRILCVVPDLFPNGGQRVALTVVEGLVKLGHQVDVASLWPMTAYRDPRWDTCGARVSHIQAEDLVAPEIAREYDVALIHGWIGSNQLPMTHLDLPALCVHHSTEVDNRPPIPDRIRIHAAVAPWGRARYAFENEGDAGQPSTLSIGNGVDTDEIMSIVVGKEESRRRLGLDAEAKILLCVTRADNEKGGHILAEMAERIVMRGWNLVVIGVQRGQPQYETVEPALRRAGAVSLGPLSHEDVVRWMDASDVLLVPSRREARSLAIMEALVVGRPVVVSVNAAPTEQVAGLFIVDSPEPDLLLSGCEEALADGVEVGPVPPAWSWGNIVRQYDAMLRMISLRDKWYAAEAMLDRHYERQSLEVSLCVEGDDAVALGQMIEATLVQDGTRVTSGAAIALSLSADGALLSVGRGDEKLGDVYLSPVAYGSSPLGSVLCYPPINVSPVNLGERIVCVGDVPCAPGWLHLRSLSGPQDLEGAALVVASSWLDTLYALLAGVPVAAVDNGWGLIFSHYNGVVASRGDIQQEITKHLSRVGFYAQNIRDHAHRLFSSNGRLSAAITKMLERDP
jgi:glycosyltransferase involved in cell wall biosynthesis